MFSGSMTELDWMLFRAAFALKGRRRARLYALDILTSDKLNDEFRKWARLHCDRDDPAPIDCVRA